MTADILNDQMEVVGIVDDFKSFIWSERCREAGDFEVYTVATPERIAQYKKKNYISMKNSKKMMIIDTIEVDTSFENGSLMLVSGKSLEYLLHKRIIWYDTELSGNLQEGVKKLVQENASNPELSYRKIPKLIFKDSEDPKITSLSFKEEISYFTENLYDVICNICKEYHICFKIEADENDNFCFELYPGVDRSFDQTENFAVIFSPEYGNLISSKYYDTDGETKNAGLVVGEKRTETFTHNDVSTTRDVQHTIELGSDKSGLDREEMFIDQTSLSMYVKDVKVPEHRYLARLRSLGEAALVETKKETSIEADVDYDGQFKFGINYFIGDILEIENHIQMSIKVRIMEVVRCHDTSGDYISQSFIPLTEEDDD